PPPTLHIPGAGTQGEFATDSLPVSKAMVTTSLAFSLVQAQLLAIEAALPRDAFRHNKWTPALRTGWADLIVHATSSRTLLEALLVLEATIENEYLDPTFKAQSSLTIKMLLPTATIASAAMRLYALDDALSYFKPQSSISPALLKDPTLKDRFIAVLQTLQTKAAVAAPFLKPVDPDEFPTYRRIVPHPMDLHTMLQRVQDGVYDSRLQHIPIDMSRIWTNCFAFNSVQAEISTLARRLRSIFQRLMEEYVVLAPAGTLPEDLICDDACRVCRAEAQEHAMLLCDSCDAAYHSLCAGLDEVPTANWYCTRCVENPELK
ncbi:hypothetical protein DYB30_013826, partial [Aphanomyces astaci]